MFNLYKRGLSLLLVSLLVLSQVSTPVYAGDTTGLEAAYLFEEASGTRFDETANDNDLTDNNTVSQATGANCKFDNCADFERDTNEWLSRTDAAQTNLDLTGNFSLGYWVRMETFPSNELFVIEKFVTNTGYVLHVNSSQFINCQTDAAAVGGSTTITAGTFFHLACTYRQTNLEVWVDGTSDGTLNTSDDPSATSEDFLIGSNVNTGANNWDGPVDDLFVFSREISEAEIDDIKDNGLAAFISSGPAFVPYMIMMMIMPIAGSSYVIGKSYRYYSLVYKFRKGMHEMGNYKVPAIPRWMRIFEIPEAAAEISRAVTDAVTAKWDSEKQSAVQGNGR